MEVPDPTNTPPQLPEYHCHEAPVPNEPPDKLNVVEPEQIGFGLAEALAGAVDDEFTVMVTEAQVVVLQVPTALT